MSHFFGQIKLAVEIANRDEDVNNWTVKSKIQTEKFIAIYCILIMLLKIEI